MAAPRPAEEGRSEVPKAIRWLQNAETAAGTQPLDEEVKLPLHQNAVVPKAEEDDLSEVQRQRS